MSNLTVFTLSIILLVFGVIILISALFPIKRIIQRLPRSQLRNRWYFLLSLTILFLFGYISYGIISLNQLNKLSDLIVPGVFFFGAWFVRLISSLSLQTAIDIRKIYKLEAENITDPLTGVYNRRYLERRLVEDIAVSKQLQSQLSILLIDIDHFKEINDNIGHHAGDQVMAKLAQLILTLIRGSDVLARFGGDEFVIIALNTSDEAAKTVAEKIVNFIQNQSIEIVGEQNATIDIKTTVSIGIATLTDEIENRHQLIENADKALYCAKHEGRNRFIVYPHLC